MSNISSVGPGVPVAGGGPVEAAPSTDVAKVTDLVKTYNDEVTRLTSSIVAGWRNIPPESVQALASQIFGIQAIIKDKTPEQLAQIPGFIDSMKQLVNVFKAAENQCTAQIKATGVADFGQLPLSNQLDGTTFTGTHGELYDDAVKMMGLLQAA